MDASRSRYCLLVLLPAALALNLWNNDFPLGFHYDEPKKVGFILEGDQDFHHPLLMLQVARGANRVARFEHPQDVAVLGRATTAFAGVLLVLCSYWLACQVLPPAISLLVACGVALTPMTVMHAHYLKEDILFAAWAIASLASYNLLLREPALRSALVLGVTTGLAGASQYKAGLLVPLYLLFPLCIPYEGRRKLFAWGGFAAFIAIDVFVLIDLPILADFDRFLRGVEHDRRQLAEQSLPIRAVDYWCTFYWSHALVPGLTLPLAITGLAGVVRVLCRWSETPREWKLLVCYVLLFYFAQELSPSKPPPNHERYMVAVSPVLILFAGDLINCLIAACRQPVTRTCAIAATVALVVHPGIVSLRLCDELSNDTRQRAEQWLRERDANSQAIREKFAGSNWTVDSVAGLDVAKLRQQGVRYVVTSSFGYEPWLRSAELTAQPQSTYEIANEYRTLFLSPCLEIQPKFRSFGFNNPVVRVVDLGTEQYDR